MAAAVGDERRALLLSQVRRNRGLALPYAAAVAVFLLGVLTVDNFNSPASVRNIMVQAAILSVVAGAQTLVIIAGGIDLSIPWTMTGAGLTLSILAEGDDAKLLWAVPLVLGVAACVGLTNGLGITVLGIPPIVMTLAMDVVLNGAVVLYALGHGSQASAPQPIQDLIYGHVAGVPGYLLVLLVTLVVFSLLLSLTTYGRRLYAVGSSVRVSRFAGVDVRVVVTASYVLSSMSAAVGGMLLLAYVNNAFFGMGDPYLFTSISAVVVGGASILGGSGHFIGTLGGALLLTVANALLVVYSLGPGAISIFYGLIILVSVTLLSSRIGTLRQLLRRPGTHRS